jgi:hypothetical protein
LSSSASSCGLRHSPYIGLAKTRLQHVITAAAINLVRVAEGFAGPRVTGSVAGCPDVPFMDAPVLLTLSLTAIFAAVGESRGMF